MKYIKTFEKGIPSNYKFNYKIDDYVILDPNLYFIRPFKCAKVIDIQPEINNLFVQAISDHYETEKLGDKIVNEYDIFNFGTNTKDILRLATPQEIEEYELLTKKSKFNL